MHGSRQLTPPRMDEYYSRRQSYCQYWNVPVGPWGIAHHLMPCYSIMGIHCNSHHKFGLPRRMQSLMWPYGMPMDRIAKLQYPWLHSVEGIENIWQTEDRKSSNWSSSIVCYRMTSCYSCCVFHSNLDHRMTLFSLVPCFCCCSCLLPSSWNWWLVGWVR